MKKYREDIKRNGKFIMPDWSFKADIFEVIKQAIQLVRKSENDFKMSDERCIELISADYIAGNRQFRDF